LALEEEPLSLPTLTNFLTHRVKRDTGLSHMGSKGRLFPKVTN
jgi:hypothetical protein